MQQQLPASPDLAHLTKQAKSLLHDARDGVHAALRRFVDALPTARGATLATLASRDLKLHDPYSDIAREYGFKSWAEPSHYVELARANDAGCARALLAHGVPAPDPDAYTFSDDVAECFGENTGVRYG